MLSAEVSLYPLKTTRASDIINESIHSLAGQGVNYNIGPISTEIHGPEEQVWSGIRSLFERASSAGEVSMVVTFSNAASKG